MKVSVIMPVYNSEGYLSAAVDSVLGQDFDDFELILVDDGSKDSSGKICDIYATKNPKVQVVHKENGGICSARNAGLSVASGEYIGFCDNDDEYLPGLLKDNYDLAKKHQVDLMRYGRIRRIIKDDGSVWETSTDLQDMFIDRKDFHKHYKNIRCEDTVWTALYRREIIEKYHIRYDERFCYGSEDLNFNLQFLLHSERLGFNSNKYYIWEQRDVHSTSRNFKKDYMFKNLINMDLEYDFMSGICQGQVDNIQKNVFLINSYIYPMIKYMALAKGKLTLKEEAAYLNRLRKHPLFDRELSRTTKKKVRKMNVRTYITMKLFYERRFRSLIFLLNKGTAFLANFRFKKK